MEGIKFRAWHKTEKKMFQVERIDWDYLTGNKISTVHLVPEDPEDEHPEIIIHDLELMQFTGLKDKNGVEIYEGDILQKFNQNAEVIYEGSAFAVEFKSWKKLPIDNYNKHTEVIGNIYKNPELLDVLP